MVENMRLTSFRCLVIMATIQKIIQRWFKIGLAWKFRDDPDLSKLGPDSFLNLPQARERDQTRCMRVIIERKGERNGQ